LKKAEMWGDDWPVIVISGVSGLALALSSRNWFCDPTTGTTEYWTLSPGATA